MNNDQTAGAIASTEGLGPDVPELDADGAPYTAERLVRWLEAKYSRHGEIEDKAAAQMLRRLSEPGTCYAPCISHRFHSYTMEMQVSTTMPMRSVCPVCAGIAKNVSGPHPHGA